MAAALLVGCDGDAGSSGDAEVPMAPCGLMSAEVTLGVGDPFMAMPDSVSIEQGLQGGYHVNLSVRLTGAFYPDHVNIELALRDASRRVLAQHSQVNWFLEIAESEPACDYLVAAMVLLNAQGELLDEDGVIALDGQTLTVSAELQDAQGRQAQAEGAVTVRWGS